jgi:hypothetical protein
MQFGQAQFHCGRPPPAALPRTRRRIGITSARSDRPGVTGALEKDRHVFHRRFQPFPFLLHEIDGHIVRHAAANVNDQSLGFHKADIAAAFHARDPNLGKVVRVRVKAKVLLQIVL